MSEDSISVEKWINLGQDNHVRGFKVFWETGKWPKGFLPKNVIVPGNNWIASIEQKWSKKISTFGPHHSEKLQQPPKRTRSRFERNDVIDTIGEWEYYVPPKNIDDYL